MDVVSFDQLLAQVDQLAASDDPLDRLDAAIGIAGTLSGQADTLIDYVVAHARAAGRSWTEIGARLGVTKQAARKRFTDPAIPSPVLPPEVSLRPRLQTCVARAEQLAQASGAAQVGAEHLLGGLLADGVAATILHKLGVTADAIAASTARLFGPANPPSGSVPPLSTEAVCAIEAAAGRAQVRAENPDGITVGTEHLLAVLALDHGSRAHRVLLDLGVDTAAPTGTRTRRDDLRCLRPTRRAEPRHTRRHLTTPGVINPSPDDGSVGRPISRHETQQRAPGW